MAARAMVFLSSRTPRVARRAAAGWGLRWRCWPPWWAYGAGAAGWLRALVGGWRHSGVFPVGHRGVTPLLVLGGWWIETSNPGMAGAAALAQRIGAREARSARRTASSSCATSGRGLHCRWHAPPAAHGAARRRDQCPCRGWDEDDAVVAVTQGAPNHLTREELQGLVAHECSHIHEGDTQLNMQLAGMVLGLELVHRLASPSPIAAVPVCCWAG